MHAYSRMESGEQMYNESSAHLAVGLLRRYALILLGECRGSSANFLRTRVTAAKTNADVLKMRAAIFECMSMHLGEAEAMDRIRSLDLSA